MPLFLTRDPLYRIIQRELPEDVYPDGSPEKFASTKESFASARLLEDAYSNLSRVYANIFPQDALEEIGRHEIDRLGALQDATQTLDERRAAVLAQIRDRRSCSRWDLLGRVLAFLPPGTPARIIGWAEIYSPGWELGASGLGSDTFLGGFVQPILEDVDDYAANALAQPSVPMLPWSGAIPLPWATAQAIAYTYEVRIYGLALSVDQRAKLELLLSRNEYGRDLHIIRDNLSRSAEALTVPVVDVDQFVNVTAGHPAVYTDETSPTGFSGWGEF